MSNLKARVVLTLALVVAVAAAAGWRQHASRVLREEIVRAREQASAALESGQWTQARELIEAALKKEASPDAESLAVMALALGGEGKVERAAKLWERLDKEHPGHQWPAESLAARAALADLDKDHIVARDLYDQILQRYPNSDAAPQARVGLFEISYRLGDLVRARAQGLTLLAGGDLPKANRGRVEQILGELNIQSLYSGAVNEKDEVYAVQAGDYVQKIAKRHNITQELLLRVNRISDPRLLGVGHRLKIPKRQFEMVVDKHENTLTVLADGQFFKKYGCRTGREDYMTPLGEFKITNKKRNPDWRKPGSGELVPAGDPENELGTRWMAFQGSSLGIHGTIDASTIGYYASQGCVGLAKEDVEELFDYIPLGTPLTIKGEQDPARRLPSA